MIYTRLYDTDDGESRFEDVEIDLVSTDYAQVPFSVALSHEMSWKMISV